MNDHCPIKGGICWHSFIADGEGFCNCIRVNDKDNMKRKQKYWHYLYYTHEEILEWPEEKRDHWLKCKLLQNMN